MWSRITAIASSLFATAALAVTPPAPALNKSAGNDFNSDFKQDLVWRRTSDGLYGVWLMDGARMVGASALPGNGGEIILHGDFNGDHRTDFIWRDASNNYAMSIMTG